MKSWLRVGAKIVCTNGKGWFEHDPTEPNFGESTPGPKMGEICTVNSIEEWDGELFLGLAEYPCDRNSDYDAECFAPVSTIDTTKTVEALRKLTLDTKRGLSVPALNTLADDHLDRRQVRA